MDEDHPSKPTNGSHFSMLLCYEDEIPLEPNREGLLSELTRAVSSKFDWSWRLATALQERNEPGLDLDLWTGVVRGWAQTPLEGSQMIQSLSLLDVHPQLDALGLSVADLLTKAVKVQKTDLPTSCLGLIEGMVDRLWNGCTFEPPHQEEPENGSWLVMAINHLGGKLVEIWLHALSKRRAQAATTWKAIPEEFLARFTNVLSGGSLGAQMGRVVLASQMHFLFAIDPSWAQDNVIPLLDWSVGEKRAQEAWYGYLTWGQLNQGMLPKLMPLYKETFSRLMDNIPTDLHGPFCRHLASIAIYSGIDPMADGWLWEFLKRVDTEVHKRWAIAVGHELESLEEYAAKELWGRWINNYWSQRITGVPVPLSPGELEEMVDWALQLSPVFPEVVERICASNPPILENTHIYRELEKKGFPAKYPVAVARLLLHFLPKGVRPFWQCDDVEKLVRSLLGTTASQANLLQTCHELERLGCPGAEALEKLCRQDGLK